MKTGIELIAIERQEQIEKHGFTIIDDLTYNSEDQFTDAVISLLSEDPTLEPLPTGWKPVIWNKMTSKTYKERVIIAGALIAAELDRINFEN